MIFRLITRVVCSLSRHAHKGSQSGPASGRLNVSSPPKGRGFHVRFSDTWHIDEVFITIQGERQYLWRAVDQDGDTIDILVQRRRNQRAAERFFRRLLKGQGREPRWLITDKLRSYDAAHRTVMPTVKHRDDVYANNRVEGSHQPTRQQEYHRRDFASSTQA
jgi:putative transposase